METSKTIFKECPNSGVVVKGQVISKGFLVSSISSKKNERKHIA